jgi:hypothetical protein
LGPGRHTHVNDFYHKIGHAMPLGNSSTSNAYNQHSLACPSKLSFHPLASVFLYPLHLKIKDTRHQIPGSSSLQTSAPIKWLYLHQCEDTHRVNGWRQLRKGEGDFSARVEARLVPRQKLRKFSSPRQFFDPVKTFSVRTSLLVFIGTFFAAN